MAQLTGTGSDPLNSSVAKKMTLVDEEITGSLMIVSKKIKLGKNEEIGKNLIVLAKGIRQPHRA